MGCACSIAAEDECVHEHYTFHEKLGEGAFGQVRACVQRGTKLQCAVKIVKVEGHSNLSQAHLRWKQDTKSRCNSDGHRTHKVGAQREGLLWKRVGCHQHVVTLLATYADEHFSYFVMEQCEHSLCDMLLKGRPQEADLVSTFRQMLLGIQACHSVGVVHRDVKPANFLVSMNGSVKLCDFGLAAVEKAGGIIGIAGSSPFMSPEMVQWKAYDSKTDIWSLGATAYSMLYGKFPYVITQTNEGHIGDRRSQLMQRAIATNSPPIAYATEKGLHYPSALVRDFVQALLQRNTNKRPSSNECLRLPAMQLEDSLRITVPSREVSLSSAIQRVKRRSAELKTPIDPTVAKTMDELIKQLQEKFQGSFTRSFSLPFPREKTAALSSRSNSHGGELSTRLVDETSDCSTAASLSLVEI